MRTATPQYSELHECKLAYNIEISSRVLGRALYIQAILSVSLTVRDFRVKSTLSIHRIRLAILALKLTKITSGSTSAQLAHDWNPGASGYFRVPLHCPFQFPGLILVSPPHPQLMTLLLNIDNSNTFWGCELACRLLRHHVMVKLGPKTWQCLQGKAEIQYLRDISFLLRLS